MYDIIIIGGGPAGLTAGLYAGRSKLKTLIIEKAVAGGQISGTAFVENYPGSLMRQQAWVFLKGCLSKLRNSVTSSMKMLRK